MAKRKVVIFGNGQLATLNHYYLTHDSDFEVAAFTVDDAYVNGGSLLGLPVVSFGTVHEEFPPADFDFSLFSGFRGLNQFRSDRYERVKTKGYDLISYISSQALVSGEARIGESCYIYEGAIVQPFACIGNNVVVSPSSLICHHAVIGDHCFLASRATILGSARIGSRCVIAASATILDGRSIGADCIIGAGAVIAKDANEKEVHVSGATERLSCSSDQFAPLLTWANDANQSARPKSQDEDRD